MSEANNPILYFDGVCNLCNGLVKFFIRRDRSDKLLFSSLQSKAGQRAISESGFTGQADDTVILYNNGKYYKRSSAILKALSLLGGIWKISNAGFIVPRFIRDGIYDWVAANRYKWFGKKEECMIPRPEDANRFIAD
jgi:predicted DCC family thiol-disulfide oxidoreductase YuxK